MSWRTLPPPARRLLAATIGGALLLAVVAIWHSGSPPSPLSIVMLAAGIALGEAMRTDLAYRVGGTATFGLSDAVLTAGLLLLTGTDLVLGAALGVLAIHVAERLAPVKSLLNTAQFVGGTAVAALIVDGLGFGGGLLDSVLHPSSVAAVALALGAFLLVNTGTVAGMIAFTSGARWTSTWLRLLPTGTILTYGNLALGILAIVVADAHPWALVALAVPVALLWSASRQGVRAKIDRERSAAFVEVEHLLAAASTPDDVGGVLAEAVSRVLGCHGAVWRDGVWSGPLPVMQRQPVHGARGDDPGLAGRPPEGLTSEAAGLPAATLGLAPEQQCLAVGLGADQALVAWSGDLALGTDSAVWVERLGRSGRVHLARADGAVALEQERATLRAVVDGTGDGVLLLAPDGTIRIWNPAMAALSGMSADAATGQHVAAVLGTAPWDVDGVHDVVHAGTDSVWRVSVASIVDAAIADEGRLRVIAVHDVTAERRAARTREDMLAVVSHELRTPLTPIKASAKLLRLRGDRLDEVRRQQLLAAIEERAGHLARLVDDLLLVGQLSAGSGAAPQLADEPVDLADVMDAAAAAAALSWGQHRVRPDLARGVRSRSDSVRLRQIVDNLLDNACKYSPTGSEVCLRLDADEAADEAIIEVRDHGRGIPPADLERVFERFVRVEDPLVMTTSGVGLGLYIVRELARSLGGTVDLRSRMGSGTTVTVRVPLAAADVGPSVSAARC